MSQLLLHLSRNNQQQVTTINGVLQVCNFTFSCKKVAKVKSVETNDSTKLEKNLHLNASLIPKLSKTLATATQLTSFCIVCTSKYRMACQLIRPSPATFFQQFYCSVSCNLLPTKGQIISECAYEIIVSPIRPTKKFPRFLPQPLRRGQIKTIKALYYTNQGLFNIIGLIMFLI